jgi:SAM-dependent methyltransferase
MGTIERSLVKQLRRIRDMLGPARARARHPAKAALSREHLDKVRRYYDANTRAFLWFGQGGRCGSIHRAVWGSGVTDRPSAFRFVERSVAAQLDVLAPADAEPLVLDLGCGVGATLAFLASNRPLRGVGITLSPVQANLARKRLASAGLEGRVRILQGDYLDLPADLRGADLAFAIESFSLGPDPAAFFASAARSLRPSGRLVICDDFLTVRAAKGEVTPRESRWLDDFRKGWRVGSLVSSSQATELARAQGLELVQSTDLSAFLELERPRDRLIQLVIALTSPLAPFAPDVPWWLNLLGGHALQQGLLAGVIEYRFCVWQKGAMPSSSV